MNILKILLVLALIFNNAWSQETTEFFSPRGKCVGIAKVNSISVEHDGSKKPCFFAKSINGKTIEICPSLKRKGEEINPSQKWVNKITGVSTFCEHGGYCYPALDFEMSSRCKFIKAHD